MGYAEIPVTGKFLKARSRQVNSFHMNDSWVPIFRSLSYLVRSWEEVTCRYKYTNIYTSKYKKTSYDCVTGIRLCLPVDERQTFLGFLSRRKKSYHPTDFFKLGGHMTTSFFYSHNIYGILT